MQAVIVVAEATDSSSMIAPHVHVNSERRPSRQASLPVRIPIWVLILVFITFQLILIECQMSLP